MATVQPAYSTNNTITISLGSLASDTNLLAGRESSEIDNTSNKYIDAIVQGKIRVGTTPTVNTSINVYVWGAPTSLGTTPLDVLDGTDSNETITSSGVRDTMLALAATAIISATTSDRDYFFKPFSVAQVLGLQTLPKYWGLFVVHNSVAALNATGGNHVWEYNGITYTV